MNLLRRVIREMFETPSRAVIHIDGFPLEVEIAADPDSRSRGLMHRDHLNDDEGMLFCFDQPEESAFWMRNTGLPLSIAFISSDGVVCQIEDLSPHSESRVVSRVPCLWAIETNRGWFSSRRVRVGSIVSGLQSF
jgi:uncharacterized membrane protein (UPF0127 family)